MVLVYAKAICQQLHPRRISQDEVTGRLSTISLAFQGPGSLALRNDIESLCVARLNKFKNLLKIFVRRLSNGLSSTVGILLLLLPPIAVFHARWAVYQLVNLSY